MKIFLIGQCTLHWGRMEFGNIGNYYIIEPFIRQLHKVFPGCEIRTTLQMSEAFCDRENVIRVPMEYYYSWQNDDLQNALEELSIAYLYNKTGSLVKETPFIKEVRESDLVIDFSGDIWGDNADFLGQNRFLVGLCKDRVAQLLQKPTVMLAGSPGPFKNQQVKAFAKEVYSNFDFVTNRESLSIELLKDNGFDISKTKSLSCPAFLFEPAKNIDFQDLIKKEGVTPNGKPNVGFILCGWNFSEGPFDKKIREDSEFTIFAEAIEHITENIGANVLLMSHSNGFPIPPKPFELLHGRDYEVIKQLQTIVNKRGIAKNFYSIDGIYDAWTIKAMIGNLDMLVSGRVHGAVAGFSQCIPTVTIDYGHEPKAHKIRGFSIEACAEEYMADPSKKHDLNKKINSCWENRYQYKESLKNNYSKVKTKAEKNFTLLKELLANKASEK